MEEKTDITFKFRASWMTCLIYSAILIAMDFYFGPQYAISLFYVLPVIWGSWHFGILFGCTLAVGFSLMRFLCHWSWGFPLEVGPAFINNILRSMSLVAVALLSAWMAAQMRLIENRMVVLGNELRSLRDKLPICVVCKSVCLEVEDGHNNRVFSLKRSSVVCSRCKPRQHT